MGQPWPILHVGPVLARSICFGLEPASFILVLGRCRFVSFHVGVVVAHFHVGPILAHFVVCWASAGTSFFMLGRAGPFQKNIA
jgi:hypothetical protein